MSHLRLRSWWVVVCAAVLAGAGAGCDEKLSDLTGPTPDLQPTFTSIQTLIFSNGDSSGRPACTNCHGSTGPQNPAGLILRSGAAYDALVNKNARFQASSTLVVPGDPNASYLVRKLEGASGIAGVRMPFGGPYLTTGQISVIRRWIAQGAKND